MLHLSVPTLLMLVAAAAPASASSRFAGSYTVTAYCPCVKCCGSHADGITATGKKAVEGMIASDWRRLPPGTKVRLSCFPGRTFVVEDRGGAIKGRRIDIYMSSHGKALRFGIRRRTKVWIVAR